VALLAKYLNAPFKAREGFVTDREKLFAWQPFTGILQDFKNAFLFRDSRQFPAWTINQTYQCAA